ncbi:serine protease [Saccharothrix sp.]|uniref:serine protease n=1 Tax=Saccharothrix sp. TaxID=1873460 RepID=UPI0028128E74|nr:serine protease [Saccharothrix sp.]
MRTLVAVLLALVTLAPSAAATEDPKIVGGTIVEDVDDYPFVVALLTAEGRQFCGGALIKPNLVMTAAHCLVDAKPEGLRVVAGRLDLTTDAGVVSKVTEIKLHPDYETAEKGDDIAWITTEQRFPGRYQPVELPEAADVLYRPGTLGTVLGWGRTAEGGQASDELREVDVPIQSNKDCEESYDEYSRLTMFCAGFPEGGKDSCQGDSGGPFVVNGKLAGLVSWGEGCARPGKPGMYTRVKSYVTD